MDDGYYNFTIKHSYVEDGVHIANVESLICLKCKAFLEMSDRKAKGEQVDSKAYTENTKRMCSGLQPCLLLPTVSRMYHRH